MTRRKEMRVKLMERDGQTRVLLVRDGSPVPYSLDSFAPSRWLRGFYFPLYRADDGHRRSFGGPLAASSIEEIYGPMIVKGGSLYPAPTKERKAS
jgi:hypothetical protein